MAPWPAQSGLEQLLGPALWASASELGGNGAGRAVGTPRSGPSRRGSRCRACGARSAPCPTSRSLGRPAPRRGGLLRGGGWSSFGGTSAVAPDDRPGSWPTPTRAATATVGLVGPGALRRGDDAAELHRRHRRATTTSPGRNGGTYAATAGTTPPRAWARRMDQNLAIALQGGDGCPSVAGLSAYTGPVSGSRAHHPHRGRPGRRHRSQLRLRRGRDDRVAHGDLPRGRPALTGQGPLRRRHRHQPAGDLGRLAGRRLRLRRVGQL